MKEDKENDQIIKNKIEMIVDRLANDKEIYIFDKLIKGLSYKGISSALDGSDQSVILGYETILDKIVGVIK
ncbi:pathogenicity island family protein [Staphylococcus aureus]|uniref:pathogenicity island family protein n=1 Tax=Staphylococcus aureus TaxID=1280 RepID=UPI0011D25A5B|nr:pathogenicity island family protein [Staphylococcus aureus]